MRRYMTEFIGRFGLVFTVGCAVMGKAALAPLAIGAALIVFVYAGGHISGGHCNPAVSLAAYLRGRLSREDLGPYWLAQAAGALVAAGSATFVVDPAPFPPLYMSGRSIGAGLVAEFIFTFAQHGWPLLALALTNEIRSSTAEAAGGHRGCVVIRQGAGKRSGTAGQPRSCPAGLSAPMVCT